MILTMTPLRWFREWRNRRMVRRGIEAFDELSRLSKEEFIKNATRHVNESLEDDYVTGGKTYDLVNMMDVDLRRISQDRHGRGF